MQEGANARGEQHQCRHAECLRGTDPLVAIARGEGELRREREEVVEHRAREGQRGDNHDPDERMHEVDLTWQYENYEIGDE